MTDRQLARRDALLAAVMELAIQRGIDDVQMKLVAERSGVALGTAYRYFASKEHLLASALVQWHSRLTDRVLLESAAFEPCADWNERVERVIGFLHRGIKGFARYPGYADLLVHVTASRDQHAAAALDEMHGRTDRALRALVGGEVDAAQFATLSFIVSSLWLHAIVKWRSSRHSLQTAYEVCESGIRLACAGLLVTSPAVSIPNRVA
jgi:AcrR family transcriptional regulator